MASPDLRNYTELVLYDRAPADLVDRAILDATTKLPGWVPREGNTEVVLIESMALEVAEMVYAINRLPGAVTEVLLRLLGITRSTGTPATTDVLFTLSDDAGHTIPAGTLVRLTVAGVDVVFATDEELVVPALATTGAVAATATEVGTVANGTAAGTALEVISSVIFLEAAELASVVSGGADPEDTSAWLDRAVERLARLTDALVLPEHFTSAALEDVRVGRATTIDLLDPAAGPAGSDPGHVTVVVADSAGAALSAPIMAEIEDALEEAALANLDVHVEPPTVTAVDVTATVVRLSGHDPVTVAEDVETALAAYLDPGAWEWGAVVRRNELIALMDAVTGVDYVDTITTPAADVPLAGVGPLAELGAVAITVDPPA
jgi:uncharacterized phage protein gp47/JayE